MASYLRNVAIVILALLIGGFFITRCSHARDLGQWSNVDPSIKEWFDNLKQPDMPVASCCGAADAYWCDDVHFRNGKTFCTITDDRDNIALMRTPVPIGTEIEIPDNKLNKDPNPTGHSIVFLSTAQYVYCFVPGLSG